MTEAVPARLGWKIGLNPPPVMEALGLERPVAAKLTSATLLDDGATAPIGDFKAALVEPEVAVEVGPGGSIARVAAAIELVDVCLPFDDLDAILADGVFHRGLVLGEFTDVVPRTVVATVWANGEERGRVDRDPELTYALESVGIRAAENGDELLEGDIVITGSLTPPVPVAPGETVIVEVAPLGRLELSLSG
jgi:2-keto-4-pentenoate hydratase